MKNSINQSQMTAGGAIFTRLKALGVDYVFANSGTDFPPVIEGLAEAASKNIPLPQALVIPHEHAAIGMAHGYYLATGKSQVVMLHTNVGLSNGATAAINAATDNIPVFIMSGRTPVMESDRFGARTVPIGWGQEMRDQAALVREVSKWEYELKFPEQISELLDRAYCIANSTPKGPVYLSLPREVLCESVPADGLSGPLTMAPARSAPDRDAITDTAKLLANAKRPLIFAQRGAGSQKSFEIFDKLVSEAAIPVCQYWANQLILPTDHQMHVGSDPLPWIEEADVILVIDSLAPWWPDKHRPSSKCKFVHMGPNPLFSRTPIRNFRSDISISGETADIIQLLYRSIKPLLRHQKSVLENRRQSIARKSSQTRKRVREEAALGNRDPMTKSWVSSCVSQAIEGEKKVTILSELGCPLDPLSLGQHGSWYQEPFSGGLGWSLPCAMGIQLADRDRLVVATMGDGSYMFSNPTVCHQIAEALKLPVLTLILNNREWGAVRNSVLGIYPDGYASRANVVPLTSLEPTPDFIKTAEASRAWTARVEKGDDLPSLLMEAIDHIKANGSQAMIDARVAQ